QIISRDSKAVPPEKYAVLTDVLGWATNVGYPGSSNAAIDETFNTWVINTMFAETAAGSESPEDALKRAEVKMKAIWAKWKERKWLARAGGAWTGARRAVGGEGTRRQGPQKRAFPVAPRRQRPLAVARHAGARRPLHRPAGRVSLPALALLQRVECDRRQ